MVANLNDLSDPSDLSDLVGDPGYSWDPLLVAWSHHLMIISCPQSRSRPTSQPSLPNWQRLPSSHHHPGDPGTTAGDHHRPQHRLWGPAPPPTLPGLNARHLVMPMVWPNGP